MEETWGDSGIRINRGNGLPSTQNGREGGLISSKDRKRVRKEIGRSVVYLEWDPVLIMVLVVVKMTRGWRPKDGTPKSLRKSHENQVPRTTSVEGGSVELRH